MRLSFSDFGTSLIGRLDAELAHLVADVREVEADVPRQLDVDARHPLVGVRESRSHDSES